MSEAMPPCATAGAAGGFAAPGVARTGREPAEGADIVIVGAGTAGCLLADRLSRDAGRRVVLLEAGGAAPPESEIPGLWASMFNGPADWSYHTEPQRGARMRRLFAPRGRMVGGSGALNAMIVMRGLPSDYDGWRESGCPGWGWEDVLPVFTRLERNARHAGALHGTAGEIDVGDPPPLAPLEAAWIEAAVAAGLPRNDDLNGARQEGVGRFQLNIRAGARASTASALLAPALQRPNLRLETGCRVLRLVTSGSRVTGVEYLRMGRVRTLAAAQEVVLAAGAVGSPQILLLSGIGPAGALRGLGIETVCDLPGVGKNLSDHPHLSTTFALRPGAATPPADRDALIREWRENRSGPLAGNGAPVAACARSAPDVAEPDLQLYFSLGAARSHGRFLAMDPGVTFGITLQRPLSLGEIRLRSADPLADPAIDPGYFTDPGGQDVAALVRGLRIQRGIAAQAPLAAMLGPENPPGAGCVSDAALADYVRAQCLTIFHLCGSCRMGLDDMAVVDPRTMAVHGLAGLRVADASVFPRMVSGNINTPVMMVAEKAAGLIAAGPAAAPTREGATCSHG